MTFGLLTAFWSVLTPLTEAPDEPAHLGLVLYVADTGRYPTHDGLHHTVGLMDFCVDYAVSAKWCRTAEERAAGIRVRERPADEAPLKDQRPHWDDPGFRAAIPGRLNQMPQHPPLYYEAMALAVRAERAVVPGELSIDTDLAFLRLLNVLLVLPIPWLAWCLARRLGASDAVGLAAALIPLGIPQFTHIGATLNNDNLFVVLVAVLMALLAGVARGDRSWRIVLLVGLVTGLALLTKGFGVVLPPVIALAYLVGSGPWRSGHARWRSSAVRGLAALAVAFAVSGWWYLAKLITTGHVMPSIEDARLSADNRLAGPRPVSEYLGSTASRIVDGFWGAFGWRRVQLPLVLCAAVTVLCVGLAVVAFRREARAAGSEDQAAEGAGGPGLGPTITRPMLVVLLCPVALLGAFVVVRSAIIYSDSGRLAFQQGRYLFAGLTAASVVVALGANHLLGRRAVPVVVAGAGSMQLVAIGWCLVGWWDADDVGLPGALRGVVAWSGWPDPVVVTILAALPVQLVVVVAFVVLGRARQRHTRRAIAAAVVQSPT